MVRIVAYSSYSRAAPSARVRLYGWLEFLGLPYNALNPGVPNHSPTSAFRQAPKYLQHLWRLAHAGPSDVSIVQREAGPWGTGLLERQALAVGNRSVYDFDDAIFLDHKRFLGDRAARWRTSVSTADLVIAGNDYLAAAASSRAKDVIVIPSCVDAEGYTVKHSYRIAGTIPRSVWIGSASTERYLVAVLPAFERLHRETGLRLTIIGAARGTHRPYIDRIPWQEGIAERRLADFDFGIMPLEAGPWERGKCAYKLLQYGAAGLPTVASPVGINGIIQDDWGAPAPPSVHDWHAAVMSLLGSEASRRRIGQRARAGVLDEYSYSAHSERWLDAVVGRGQL